MYQVYQIKIGETLNKIADNLNINIEELKRLNGFSDNVELKEGSFIIIPNQNTKIDNNKYIIKKGDTLYSIAKQNNIDYQTLVRINGFKDNEYIYPNQEIIIPNQNVYITHDKEKIRDLLNKNFKIEEIENLYIEPDQIINY